LRCDDGFLAGAVQVGKQDASALLILVPVEEIGPGWHGGCKEKA
jgi:hypothetical protein